MKSSALTMESLSDRRFTECMTLSLLIAATISTGLVAGLLYGFACAVMPGLRQVDDATFVSVFRAINRRIINGWFLIAFVGSPVLIIATGVAQFLVGGEQPWAPLAAAAALTVISSAITGRVNVPLNNTLDAAGSDDPARVRSAFAIRWRRANIARSAASTASFGALIWAIAIS
jgi:uncharacterized membrane protein